MCGPSPKKDKAGEKAEEAEWERQSRIKQGMNNIDLAFEGFDSPYFNRYGRDFQNYYLPQLDRQFSNAKKGLTFNLFRTGNQENSTAADQYGNAHELYTGARTDIANKALDATNQLRGRIEDQKTNLYALNSSAADPGRAISSAQSATALLNQPASYAPMTDVFASLLNSGAQAVAAERQGYRGTGTGAFAPPPSYPSYYNNYTGSSYIVR